MEFKPTHIENGRYRIRYADGREELVTPEELHALRQGGSKAVTAPEETKAVQTPPEIKSDQAVPTPRKRRK